MRLECTILRRDARDRPEPAVEVLNEVVVDRGSGPYLTKIECWERDHLITKAGASSNYSTPFLLSGGSMWGCVPGLDNCGLSLSGVIWHWFMQHLARLQAEGAVHELAQDG